MTINARITNPKVSIVIPTYKGEKSIAKLVEQLILQLCEISLEIIIVNDSSPDESHSVCMNIQKNYPFVVRYIRLGKNVGEHSAVMAGLNYAAGDYVAIIDDDFQNPPIEVLRLVEYTLDNHFDVVYTAYTEKKHSWFRNFGSWVNDVSASMLLGKPRSLYLSSFKCLSRYVLAEIIKYKGPFPYVDGLILKCTDNIGVLTVEHSDRAEGESGYTFKKLMQLWLNMAINFSFLPLRISFILGILFATLGVGYSFYTIMHKIFDPSLPTGWASLIITICIFSGVQLILLGVIGEYLGKVLMGVNQLPQYSVKGDYNSKDKLEVERN